MEDWIEVALHTLSPEEGNTYTMTVSTTHHCLHTLVLGMLEKEGW